MLAAAANGGGGGPVMAAAANGGSGGGGSGVLRWQQPMDTKLLQTRSCSADSRQNNIHEKSAL